MYISSSPVVCAEQEEICHSLDADSCIRAITRKLYLEELFSNNEK